VLFNCLPARLADYPIKLNGKPNPSSTILSGNLKVSIRRTSIR